MLDFAQAAPGLVCPHEVKVDMVCDWSASSIRCAMSAALVRGALAGDVSAAVEVRTGGLTSVPTGPYVALLNVSTSPHPPSLNVPTQLMVTATDPVTGAAVSGDVDINGTKAATTGA
jgi:hypothetical protein